MPILITPVLSRVMERIIVRSYIYPAFLCPPSNLNLADQFAFRPTGSTTAALITLLHTITSMLTKSPCVRVIALDFSKAFDTVRYCTLLHKLSTLPIPDEIYNWIRDFFDNRSHCTKFCGEFSHFILDSVIQGSICHRSCLVMSSMPEICDQSRGQ